METFSYDQTGPKNFILATDGAFSEFQKDNDQVWALHLDGSETKPFCLQTTYNLRARSMRVFPNFVSDHRRLNQPEDFERLPRVINYTPATIRVNFRLLIGADIQFECYLPEPEVLLGAIHIKNLNSSPLRITSELCAILVPMGKGMHTRPEKHGNNQILTGHTDNLWPVLFMSSGPLAIANPYPALSKRLDLDPQKSSSLTWALVTQDSHSGSLEKAQKIIATPWQRESQRHRIKHAQKTIRIKTGNTDWDAALCMAQTSAMNHLVTPPNEKPGPFFIRKRLPDQGTYQKRSWQDLDNLSVLEANHLSQVLIPAHAEILKNIVKHFLNRQDNRGRLASRLYHSEFRPSFQECPLLATICLNIYEINNDSSFLERVFPDLCRLLESWIKSDQKTDDLGPFTWENPQQCQLNSGFYAFDMWESTGRGLDMQMVESPALVSMLYRETQALHKMASILENRSAQKHYDKLEKLLQKKLGEFWQDKINGFAYRDSQSRTTPPRELVYPGVVQKRIEFKKVFSLPQRLQLHLYAADENTKNAAIHFEGESPDGEPIFESFKNREIRWVMGRAHLTTQRLYRALHAVSIEGLSPQDNYLLETANLCQADITCLLPLWSGGIRKVYQKTILESHFDPKDPALAFGIPEVWECLHKLPKDLPKQVNIMWNTLIIEGLVREGFQEEAVALFTNLMSAITRGLKDYDGFYPFYDSENGCPCGSRNTIAGLVPVRLFLNMAGIRLFSPTRVAIWGQNPFPWPIEIQWQGLSLVKEGPKTKVSFPNGSIFEDDSQKPILLTPVEIVERKDD